MIGQTLGHYRVLDKLGAGGMGEVYRAEDTTLGREVAIKVLLEAFTEDPERMARFEREAKLLASLNHPHIAQIHSLEEIDGQKLLVMELVGGQTLSEHIKAGPMSLEDALPIALQIAKALEAAHERGIVHRDLKPANIKLTPGGEVKVLDFGLAKPVADAASADLSHSPTLTYSPTQAGVLLGTAAYMSPEQARGQEVDKRTDVWAFGNVLYEMLTGNRLFDGETVSDVLAAVLRADPDWQSLPDETPSDLNKLLRRCLTRDPNDRLHDIADARIELEETISAPEIAVPDSMQMAATPITAPQRFFWFLVGLVLAVVVGAAVWLWLQPEPGPPQIRRFQLDPPPDVAVSAIGTASTLAISPDGKWVAFRGHRTDTSPSPQLYLRSIEELEARPVEGTQGAWSPFFSPDSRWLGFVVDEVLKKVPVSGGEPLPICDAPYLRGASWGADGTILFSLQSGLLRVSADGGEPEVVTSIDRERGESSHRWPEILPGGQTALMMVRTGPREENGAISLLSLETGEYRTLLTGGSFPRYLSTGHILYSRLGSLHAVPFDLKGLEVTGRPQRVLEGVHYFYFSGAIAFDVSLSGALVYSPGASQVTERELVWVDRDGSLEPLSDDRQPFVGKPALSPDGRRAAVCIESTAEDRDIWVYELERGSWSRLTTGGSSAPLWSPDGKWIVFSSERAGGVNLFRVRVDETADLEQLTGGIEWDHASSFSPDGNVLAFSRQTETGEHHVLTLNLEEQAEPEPFLASKRSEFQPAFSPDGAWLAYASDRSGQSEVYLRPFPGSGPTVKVSANSGLLPIWNPNGQELFYWGQDNTVWTVSIGTEPELTLGKPRLLFRAERMGPFAVSADGERFLTVRHPEEDTPELQIVYIPNWFDEMDGLVQAED